MTRNALTCCGLFLGIVVTTAQNRIDVFPIDPSEYIRAAQREADDPQASMKSLLESAGIDFNKPDCPRFFFNDRTRKLYVSGNVQDLALIKLAFERANAPSAHVALRVGYVEGPADAIIPRLAINPSIAAEMQREAGGPVLQPFSRAILTEGAMKEWLLTIEKIPGIDIATAPLTMILSGRMARIAIDSEQPVLIPPFHAPDAKTKEALKFNAE
jgi:hypothetical protein